MEKEPRMTAHPPTFPRGSLNAALDAFKAAWAREWPPEALALVNQRLAELAESSLQERALQAGDAAPNFTLPAQGGRLVASQALLAQGRWSWCSTAASGASR
jgi:hypothetical protein